MGVPFGRAFRLYLSEGERIPLQSLTQMLRIHTDTRIFVRIIFIHSIVRRYVMINRLYCLESL